MSCVCIIMHTFSINTWSKIDVEAIKHNGEKWINEKHLENAVGYKNLARNKIQYYSDEFEKEDVKYKIVKIFSLVENLLRKN